MKFVVTALQNLKKKYKVENRKATSPHLFNFSNRFLDQELEEHLCYSLTGAAFFRCGWYTSYGIGGAKL